MLSRRQLIKLGLLTGGAVVLPWHRVLGHTAHGEGGPVAASPAVEPFRVPLPIPPVLSATKTADGVELYEVTMKEAVARILPGRETPVWTYQGLFPGPTIKARTGEPVVVRQTNHLGVPTSVHLHGARTPAGSDGHPLDLIEPGGTKDYVYPHQDPAHTMWYHDHALGKTGRNIYMGLAAFYLLRDDHEDALGLPRDGYDVPLAIADRRFADDGTLIFPGGIDGVTGDTILVNGAVQPFFRVARRRYRFRILNASNFRLYRLRLGDGDRFTQIGTDGGLLAAPLALTEVPLSPAERVELVIDFRRYRLGDQVVLRNLAGRGRTADIMRFDVVRNAADDTVVPKVLREIEPLTGPAPTRDFSLDLTADGWVINGRPFSPFRFEATPELDSVEIWRFTNHTAVLHPMHIHLIQFQILDRNGQPPQPFEAGWKDTVGVRPGERLRVIARFVGYPGTYVLHCHRLEHEDHDMMAQYRVTP